MNLRLYAAVILSVPAIFGCSSAQSEPARYWGGMGFSYEGGSSPDRVSGKRATMDVGFQKEIGSGFGVGFEAAAVRR